MPKLCHEHPKRLTYRMFNLERDRAPRYRRVRARAAHQRSAGNPIGGRYLDDVIACSRVNTEPSRIARAQRDLRRTRVNDHLQGAAVYSGFHPELAAIAAKASLNGSRWAAPEQTPGRRIWPRRLRRFCSWYRQPAPQTPQQPARRRRRRTPCQTFPCPCRCGRTSQVFWLNRSMQAVLVSPSP